METENQTLLTTTFEEDVYNGLSSYPKYLYSKYFYDEIGDKLFQDIMALPEYYLTNAEYDIFELHKEAITSAFAAPQGFDLIELGAGDGKKTKVLLSHLLQQEMDFEYLPIDISQNALDKLELALHQELPGIKVKPQQGTYFEVLDRLSKFNERKKVIMVLGSNIGNLLHDRAIEFLRSIQESMNAGDLLFMGFDQKKHPQTILNAYNDPTGVTAAFNKNVLTRINRELDANFDLEKFMHWETYDPESGTAKSYLVATEAQKVGIKKMNLEISFDQWETIHTEISQKYDDKVVRWLASEASLEIVRSFTDNDNYYKNYVFTKKLHCI